MTRLRFALFHFFFFLLIHADAANSFSFTGKFYSISFDAKNPVFIVKSIHGETIFSLSNYYGEYGETGNKKDTLRIKTGNFSLVDSKKTKSGQQVTLNFLSAESDMLLTVDFQTESAEIIFSAKTNYRKNVSVFRESLLFDFDVPVSEVYRKNRQLHDQDFQDEYWLDKEGVKFGSGTRSAFIYHVPKISSLQLNTLKNELVVNLDYFKDHPFQHFPLLEGKTGQKEDLSCSVYKTGESRVNTFSIFAGEEITALPRLMLNPGGFLSTYVFTEHADWSDIRSHRAVYFGSEDITNADQATGGFVKNKIPVTKSVFYANPDHVMNTESKHEDIFTTPIASIKETDGFLDFLKQLNERGNDICLHTPDQFTSERPLLEEAISFMKTNFNSVSWIDHGYDNGAKNNREDFVCDGLIQTSASFAKDYWEKYGTKYFWNSYFEDFTTGDSLLLFNASQQIPYIGFGDFIPTPNYWQHPTMTGNLYSWYTRDLLEIPEPSLWNYHFSKAILNDFVSNGSVKFNHCYPAGGVVGKGFWKTNEQKKIMVEPEFEKTLERFAQYRDSGLINLSTVRDMLNYWTDCENIKFEYLADGKIKIVNQNKHDIKDLSLTVKSTSVLTDGKTPFKKKNGSDLIFWFDLKAEGSVLLETGK